VTLSVGLLKNACETSRNEDSAAHRNNVRWKAGRKFENGWATSQNFGQTLILYRSFMNVENNIPLNRGRAQQLTGGISRSWPLPE
jgi:hypothetical protein